MKLFLQKFFRVFFILWGIIGVCVVICIVSCVASIYTYLFQDRTSLGGDFGDVAFMFESGGMGKPNFEKVEYRYDSARSFTGDGISVYIVKTKNVNVDHLDKNFWFVHDTRLPVISEAIEFLDGIAQIYAPEIDFDSENIYIAPLFIHKYDSVSDASLLVYDAENSRLYYLNLNI